MSEPLISIIVPTYNCASFLKEALQSVVCQSYKNWEVVVVNNFSTDSTEEVVHSFLDERIRLINFKNSGIIAASRNEGIKVAKGEVIAFLDSDDIWDSNKLELCISELFEKQAHLVFHKLRLFKNGKILRDSKAFFGEATFKKLLLSGNPIMTSSVVVKRDVIDAVGIFNVDPSLLTSEDYDLWLKLSFNGYKLVFLNELLGSYRLHGNNASGKIEMHLNSVQAVLNVHATQLPPTLINKILMRRRVGQVYFGAGRNLALAGGNNQEIRTFFLKSLCIFPGIKSLAGLLSFIIRGR